MPAAIDLFILSLTILLPLAWYFRDSLPIVGGRARAGASSSRAAGGPAKKGAVEEGDPRDFVGKMERGVSWQYSYTLKMTLNVADLDSLDLTAHLLFLTCYPHVVSHPGSFRRSHDTLIKPQRFPHHLTHRTSDV